jgi:hypothetical protein
MSSGRAWEVIDEKMRDVEKRFRRALTERWLVPKIVGPDGNVEAEGGHPPGEEDDPDKKT